MLAFDRVQTTCALAILPDTLVDPGWKRFYVRDPGGNRIEIGCPA